MTAAPSPATTPATAIRSLVERLRRGEAASHEDVQGLLGELHRQPPSAAWHPTGFVVLEPFRDDRGSLRVHLWPVGVREHGRPCWPVHDHVWHLRSQVLCGRVRSHGYAVRDDAEGDAVLYAVEYGAGRRSRMRRSERRVSVRSLDPERVEAGEGYRVEAGAFHASAVDEDQLAATLVLTQATGRAHPWVVGPVDGPAVVPVLRPRVTEDGVRAMLGRVMAACA